MKEKLTKLFAKIRRFFRIYTNTEHDTVCKALNAIHEQENISYKGIIESKNDEIDDLQEQVKRLKAEMDTIRENAENMKSEVLRLKNVPNESSALIKSFQKTLSEALHGSEEFGFQRSVPIPGSSCVRSSFSQDHDDNGLVNKYTVIRTRTIALDSETAKINEIPDLYGKIYYLTQIMQDRDILNRFAHDIIMNGGANVVLAYNPNCTNYELYCEATLLQPKTALIITKDGETKMTEE